MWMWCRRFSSSRLKLKFFSCFDLAFVFCLSYLHLLLLLFLLSFICPSIEGIGVIESSMISNQKYEMFRHLHREWHFNDFKQFLKLKLPLLAVVNDLDDEVKRKAYIEKKILDIENKTYILIDSKSLEMELEQRQNTKDSASLLSTTQPLEVDYNVAPSTITGTKELKECINGRAKKKDRMHTDVYLNLEGYDLSSRKRFLFLAQKLKSLNNIGSVAAVDEQKEENHKSTSKSSQSSIFDRARKLLQIRTLNLSNSRFSTKNLERLLQIETESRAAYKIDTESLSNQMSPYSHCGALEMICLDFNNLQNSPTPHHFDLTSTSTLTWDPSQGEKSIDFLVERLLQPIQLLSSSSSSSSFTKIADTKANEKENRVVQENISIKKSNVKEVANSSDTALSSEQKIRESQPSPDIRYGYHYPNLHTLSLNRCNLNLQGCQILSNLLQDSIYTRQRRKEKQEAVTIKKMSKLNKSKGKSKLSERLSSIGIPTCKSNSLSCLSLTGNPFIAGKGLDTLLNAMYNKFDSYLMHRESTTKGFLNDTEDIDTYITYLDVSNCKLAFEDTFCLCKYMSCGIDQYEDEEDMEDDDENEVSDFQDRSREGMYDDHNDNDNDDFGDIDYDDHFEDRFDNSRKGKMRKKNQKSIRHKKSKTKLNKDKKIRKSQSESKSEGRERDLKENLLLKSPLQYLFLGYNGIGDKGLMTITESLLRSTCSIKYLDLRYNKITDEGIHYLARGLKTLAAMVDMNKVKSLELRKQMEKNSNMDDKLKIATLRKMKDLKQKFCKLQYLNLSGNQCSIFAFTDLVHALGKIRSLKGIDLGDMKILPKSLKANGGKNNPHDGSSSGSSRVNGGIQKSMKLRSSQIIDDIVFSSSKSRGKDTIIEEIPDYDEEDDFSSEIYSDELDEEDDDFFKPERNKKKAGKYKTKKGALVISDDMEKFDDEDEDLYSDESFYSSAIRDVLLNAMAEWQTFRDEDKNDKDKEIEETGSISSDLSSSLQSDTRGDSFTIGLIGFEGLRDQDIERIQVAANESKGYFKILL